MSPNLWVLLLFMSMKFEGHIDWSWWVVLIPLYFQLVVWVYIGFKKRKNKP